MAAALLGLQATTSCTEYTPRVECLFHCVILWDGPRPLTNAPESTLNAQ